MKKIAIIDGNNMAYKCFAVMKESRDGLLRTTMGIPTTVIYGLLRTFNMLTDKLSVNQVIVCWDTSGSKFRREIFPLYKKHRKHEDMQDYFEELDTARQYMKIFGISQMTVKGVEADDVIGFLSEHFCTENKVVVVSDDKDFYQLTRKNVKIYRPIKDTFVTKNYVVDEYGVKPYVLNRIKALTGEATDFIPGAHDIDEKNMKLIKCGLGEKTAIKILGGRNLRDAIDNCEIERWKDRLQDKKEQILMSFKLAKIRTKMKQYKDWEKPLLKQGLKGLDVDPPTVRKALRIVQDLEIKSFNIIKILKKLGIKVK